jgi:hypothetical protein
MLNNIYNTITKTLSRGLIVSGLLAVVLSGFVVGGGVKVEAQGTAPAPTTPPPGAPNGTPVKSQTSKGEDLYELNGSKYLEISNNGFICQVPVVANADLENGFDVAGGVLKCKKTGTDFTVDEAKSCYAVNSYKKQLGNSDENQKTKLNCNAKENANKLFNYWENFDGANSSFVTSDGKRYTIGPNAVKKLCGESSNLGACTKITTEAQLQAALKQACETKTKAGEATGDNWEIGDVTCPSAAGVAPGSSKITKNDNFGDFFTIIYKIIAAIIFALLFIIRYFQMFVLLMAISVMTVLLNLSPNTSFLTNLAVPLWGIFAQIANLGAVGLLIYLGAATMIGIMKYQDAVTKGTQIALYTFVSSFTYFGLAFVISLLDGFTKLIVFVFGGGSVFKLFEALIGSVSSISSIENRADKALIPDIGQLGSGIGNIFGQTNAGDVTTKLVSEIIVVIGLTLILIVFKNIFFMLLTRVAILLLLLITSPLWVLGYLVRDSLPSKMKGMMETALTLTLNSIAFNFVFVLTLVLVTIITQRINAGTSDFINGLGKTAFLDGGNGGFALLDPVTASAQSITDGSFDGFGKAFTKTISVCVILSMNLIIIQKAFEFVETLIDQNIKEAGAKVGGAISKNLQNFRKADSFKQGLGMMGQDVFKGASYAITGDNQLLKDAGGAGAKFGNQVGKGVVGTTRFARDAGGVRTKAVNDFKTNWKNGGERFNEIRANPLRSLRNTIADRSGLQTNGINRQMIDDYDNKRKRNTDEKGIYKPLTIQEETRQKERLQQDIKFKEKELEDLNKEKNSKITPENIAEGKKMQKEYDETLAEYEKLNDDLNKKSQEVKDLNSELDSYSQSKGIPKGATPAQANYDITYMSLLSKQQKANQDKISLDVNYQTAKAKVTAKSAEYDAVKEKITPKNSDGVKYSDVIKSKSNELGNSRLKLQMVGKTIQDLGDSGRNSFGGNVNRWTNDAETISGDINSLARGGKANTKFKDEADFQEAAIKEALEAKKERAEQAEIQKKEAKNAQTRHEESIAAQKAQTEALKNLFNSGRTPPPAP